MYRHEMEDLERWRDRARRKPLIVRGARQVGKTTLVRLFAERCFDRLAELNFERDPQLASLFSSNDPATTLERLELQLDLTVKPGRTLLFLDEIVRLRKVFERLPLLVGDKLKYVHIDRGKRARIWRPRCTSCRSPASPIGCVTPPPTAFRWAPRRMSASSKPCSSTSA